VSPRHTVTRMSTTDASRAPRRRPGRPKGAAGGDTRERILAAAATLFAETGYRGTSMMAVADAAGLSQTGLLHHFPSKELLLAGVLQRRDEQDMAALDLGSEPRGWEVLEQMATLAEHNTHREPFVRLFTAMAGEAIDAEHPGHDWLRSHHRHAADMIVAGLRQAQADGTCAAYAPLERIAHVTLAVMDGLQIQWLMDPDGVDMAGDLAAYVGAVRERWGTTLGKRTRRTPALDGAVQDEA
jgi:AcrR family transcriptional regulator